MSQEGEGMGEEAGPAGRGERAWVGWGRRLRLFSPVARPADPPSLPAASHLLSTRSVAYGKIEVFEGGTCEVDLFVQDQEGTRISDECAAQRWLASKGGLLGRCWWCICCGREPSQLTWCPPPSLPLPPPPPLQGLAGRADRARSHRRRPARPHRHPVRRGWGSGMEQNRAGCSQARSPSYALASPPTASSATPL